ncbi:MAG: glycosyltransferase family 4 protein [Planctomycetes bacterium]|nr:glycosyltransferase family 4 protein [Planctomycetota bacterium]
MKVALISEWIDPWRGGAETSTTQFLHHLMDRGTEVHLFTRSRPSPTPTLKVHYIGGATMSRTRRSVTFAHRVARLVRQDRYDVIHAISPCTCADIYQPRGGTVAESIERNLAIIPSGPGRFIKRYGNRFNFKQRYSLAMEREIFGGGVPIIVAISDYVIDQLRRHYDVPLGAIRKIYNGVNPDDTDPADRRRHREEVRREYHIADDHCLVLLIAHNFRLKGVARWMEAMALIKQHGVTNVRSLVIGKGDSLRWHRLAARLGVADCVTFTGPSDRIQTMLHAGDVLVHPTYYDPCSRVVLEALSCGLPCITTSYDGASEVIEPGKHGLVVSTPDDVDELARAVVTLADPQTRARISAACKPLQRRIAMHRHVDEMLSLYHDLGVQTTAV